MCRPCEMKNRIRAYQFALTDLAMFLDTHPDDHQAWELRQVYRERLEKLIEEYEQHYGTLIMQQNDVDESWRQWVNDPWPWDITREVN